MDQKTYCINKYLEEYRNLQEGEKEEWLIKFFITFEDCKNKYESTSSNLTPEAAELIGEFRERSFIVSWLKEMERSHADPLTSAVFEYAAEAISRGSISEIVIKFRIAIWSRAA